MESDRYSRERDRVSEGLSWQPETDDLIDEIRRAARRFQKRFDRRPNVCRMRGAGILKASRGIRIVNDETITPGHFLLCYEEEENEV
jgi:hypothetical protein